MFWGSFSARIDDKGRLKVPTAFRAVIEGRYGDLLFVTSLSGESVRLYPMPVWVGVEEKLREVPSMLPALIRFVDRVSYYGQPANLDKQGRISIHGRLRDSADMTGEVDVLGRNDYLEVWNHERLQSRLDQEPLTKDDLLALSEYGI